MIANIVIGPVPDASGVGSLSKMLPNITETVPVSSPLEEFAPLEPSIRSVIPSPLISAIAIAEPSLSIADSPETIKFAAFLILAVCWLDQ